MRLLKINLLAVAALLFLAASASAYEIRLTTDYTGAAVSQSDYITVQIWLDTQGESNVQLIEYGVTFDTATLSYERSLSTIGGNPSPYAGYPNYILYGSAPTGRTVTAYYMEPRVPVPSGFTYDPPYLVLPGQVNGGWVEVNLGGTVSTATNQLLATLVFHVVPGAADGNVGITLTEGGTIFQLGDNTNISGQVNLVGGFAVNIVPEPTTALLIGLGIIGLGVAGRRR